MQCFPRAGRGRGLLRWNRAERGAGPQMQLFKNALWISSFLWSWGRQRLVSLQAPLSLLGRAASVPPPQLRSRYLGSPFPCHFPFPPIAWVCSLQLGNPVTPFTDRHQSYTLNSWIFFISSWKWLTFSALVLASPRLRSHAAWQSTLLLRVLTEPEGFFFNYYFFFRTYSNTCCKKRAGVVSVKHPSALPPDRREP